jgi:hypothetical protein
MATERMKDIRKNTPQPDLRICPVSDFIFVIVGTFTELIKPKRKV